MKIVLCRSFPVSGGWGPSTRSPGHFSELELLSTTEAAYIYTLVGRNLEVLECIVLGPSSSSPASFFFPIKYNIDFLSSLSTNFSHIYKPYLHQQVRSCIMSATFSPYSTEP